MLKHQNCKKFVEIWWIFHYEFALISLKSKHPLLLMYQIKSFRKRFQHIRSKKAQFQKSTGFCSENGLKTLKSTQFDVIIERKRNDLWKLGYWNRNKKMELCILNWARSCVKTLKERISPPKRQCLRPTKQNTDFSWIYWKYFILKWTGLVWVPW